MWLPFTSTCPLSAIPYSRCKYLITLVCILPDLSLNWNSYPLLNSHRNKIVHDIPYLFLSSQYKGTVLFQSNLNGLQGPMAMLRSPPNCDSRLGRSLQHPSTTPAPAPTFHPLPSWTFSSFPPLQSSLLFCKSLLLCFQFLLNLAFLPFSPPASLKPEWPVGQHRHFRRGWWEGSKYAHI